MLSALPSDGVPNGDNVHAKCASPFTVGIAHVAVAANDNDKTSAATKRTANFFINTPP